MRTLKELAQEAIDVQNASNLSGVVHSFSRTMTELREIMMNDDRGGSSVFSTAALNKHPIAILYSNKIASLTGSEETEQFSIAYRWAEDQGVKIRF